MKGDSVKKYTVFVVALSILVFADFWTKRYAEDRLATQNMSHMILEIDEEYDGSTVEEYLTDELRANSADEVADIAARHTLTYDGAPLTAESELAAGDTIEIRQRQVVVIEDYWDFQYTRNPGAAFGMLADADESFRKPFFITVSLLAVLIILVLLRGVPFRQQLLFWGLTLIAAGAIGNFIDRMMFGYVIDFVVWKYTDEHRWPTFNVADVLICVGVALMAVEMVREGLREHREGKEGETEEIEAK